jgi:hypothetical protein
MALTEIPIELSSTPSIVDGGNATAITIGSDESATFAGNVGIGNSNSTYAMQVKKDIDAFAVKIENDGNSAGTSGNSYADASDGLWVDTRWNTASNTPFQVTTNSGGVPIIVAKGDGSVGVGTSSPSRALSTKSSSVTVANFESTSGTAGFISFSDSNTTNDVTVRAGAVGDNLVLQAGGAERLQITATGLVHSSIQYTGGFGAQSSGGTNDFNHSSNARAGNGFSLLQGVSANGPGGTAYFHIFNYEYTSKNGTGNMTQLIYGYNSNLAYQRYRYSGTWSSWVALH